MEPHSEAGYNVCNHVVTEYHGTNGLVLIVQTIFTVMILIVHNIYYLNRLLDEESIFIYVIKIFHNIKVVKM